MLKFTATKIIKLLQKMKSDQLKSTYTALSDKFSDLRISLGLDSCL